MQALAERTGAFFVRHVTVPHQMTVNNKFGTEQGAAPLLRQHSNAQSKPEERPPLWWAAAEIEDAKDASTPGLAPSFAVNEANTSWVSSPNLSWAQQGEGSKYELLAYTWKDYSGLRTAPASGACPRRWAPIAAPGGLLWLKLIVMLCAFGATSLVGKSKMKPCR